MQRLLSPRRHGATAPPDVWTACPRAQGGDGFEGRPSSSVLEGGLWLDDAPREFYLFVDEVLKKLNMERLTTEPCLWRLTAHYPWLQKQWLKGAIMKA